MRLKWYRKERKEIKREEKKKEKMRVQGDVMEK